LSAQTKLKFTLSSSCLNSPAKNVVKTYHILGMNDIPEVPVNEVAAAFKLYEKPDE